MLRLGSQASDAISNMSINEEDLSLEVDFSSSPNRESTLHMSQSHFVGHTGGVMDENGSQASTLPLISASFPLSSQFLGDVHMKRSSSTETNASAQSRLSRRSQEQVVSSSRPLAPKTSGEGMSRESSSEHHRKQIQSEDGSSKEVVSITKVPYVRPPHDKVMCSLCEEHPNGFRGEHELRRHTDRKHREKRRVWTCLDISEGKKFLSKCKKCNAGKKYNAYYNAAAHLRRTHFHPKQKNGKGKLTRRERRGGMGGGDQPSMETLKLWMIETEEFVPQNMTTRGLADLDDDDEDSSSETHNDTTEDVHESSPLIQPYTPSSMGPPAIPSPGFNVAHALRPIDHTTLYPSAPNPFQHHDSTSLQLTTSTSSSTDLFDLSLDTSMNTDLIFDMSPFDNPDFDFGLDDSSFPY